VDQSGWVGQRMAGEGLSSQSGVREAGDGLGSQFGVREAGTGLGWGSRGRLGGHRGALNAIRDG
jgi:hypothetical protein